MPIEVADLVATIRADLSGLTAGINSANTQVKAFAATSGANLSGFSNSVASSTAKAGGAMDNFGKSTKTAGVSMDGFFTTLKVGVGIATAAAGAFAALAIGIFEITKNANQASGALYDMSVKTGVAVPVLSALKFGAEESGISIQRVGVAITQFEKNLLMAAEGSKSAQANLARFRLTSDDTAAALSGNVTPALIKVLDQIGQMPAGAAKAGAEMKLFGRAGADIGVIMQNLGNNIEDSIDKLQTFGVIVSQESAEKAKIFNNALYTLEAELGSIGRTIAEAVGPSIVKIIQVITDVFIHNQDTVKTWAGYLKSAVEGVAGAFIGLLAQTRIAFAGMEGSFQAVLHFGQLLYELGAVAAEVGTTFVLTFKGIGQAIAGDMAGAATSIGQAAAASAGSMDRLKTAYTAFQNSRILSEKNYEAAVVGIRVDEIRQLGQLDNLLNSPAGGGDGPDPQTKTAKVKKTPNDGSDALMRAQETLAKTVSEMKIKIFKEEIEDERSALQESFAQRQTDYEDYYSGLIELAKRERDQTLAIDQAYIAELTAAQAKAISDSQSATTDKGGNEAMKKATEIQNQIVAAYGRMADAGRKFTQEQTKDTNEITKNLLAIQKESDDANIKMLKAFGGESAVSANLQEIANGVGELHLKLDAAAAKGNQFAIAILKDAEALGAFQQQVVLTDGAAKAYSNTLAENAADEERIRREIALGLITDKDAQDQLDGSRNAAIISLTLLIAKQKELIAANPGNTEEIAKLKAYYNEINKLKDLDLSPLARFFKGLSDSTKTFQEEFGDALQTLGQSIKQTLGTAFNSLFHGDVKGFFHGLVSGFQDALAQMASALLASQLTKLLAQILGSVIGGLAGGIGGGGGFAGNIGGGGSLTGGLGGGFFASGGILPAGQSGVFGENGPERFMSLPGGGTRVWSNPVTTSGSNVTHVHNWNINTPDSQSFMGKQSQTMIERKLAQTTQRGRKVS